MATLPVGHLEQVRALAASPRLCFVAGIRADAGSEITAYDHVAEKPAYSIHLTTHVLALAASGELLIAGGADGSLRAFALKDGRPVWQVQAHPQAGSPNLAGGCNAVGVSSRLVASGGADGVLRVFTLTDGKPKQEWALSSRPLRAVAIDPAAESFAAGGDDGIVRVVHGKNERREMPGHEGPVLALTFTPADGRLVSGGEDGTVRVWYLVGDVESDQRGKDDALHTGGTTALLFPPAKDTADTGERLVSVGADGKVRVWRMSERRKPRTFETGSLPLFGLTFVPSTKTGTLGSLVTAGDARALFGFAFDAAGAPADRSFKWGHGFDVFAEALVSPARATREGALKSLAPLGEPEALALVVRALEGDVDPDVRALAATELAGHGRRDARRALRGRLDDDHAAVRRAALAALVLLEAETPLAPLRAGLDSKFADIRIAAVTQLAPLASTSPLVPGLISARLADSDAGVRRVALKALVSLHPERSTEPLKTAFERGQPDVRAEVLVRGALAGLVTSPDFAPLIGRALDDDDSDVRRIAFVTTVLARPELAPWLESKDEPFGRAVADVLRRGLEVMGVSVGPDGLDSDVSRVIDVGKQFARFTHPKHGEVAIFKPQIHTPLKPGDEVRLVGVRPDDRRATDYVVGAPAPSAGGELAALRARLVPDAQSGLPSDADREPLLAALACRSADTALRGARGLALFGDMRALGALLTISREPSPELRGEAAKALVALRDPRAKRRLAWMMNDVDAAVRSTSMQCFTALESSPLLLADAALQSSQEDIRMRGLDILVKEGKGQEAADGLLRDSIDDESPRVRGEAFRTLWAWHDSDPLGPLDRTLLARFPDLRVRAVAELLVMAKDPKSPLAAAALERLGKAIGDRDYAVAKAAYDASLEVRGKEDEASHLAAIASAHPLLRAQGAKDTVKASFERLRSPLSRLLEDTDAAPRTAAVEALDRLSTEAGPVAVGLQSSFLDLRVRAAELLAVRREESLIDPMQALIADKDLLVRLPAAVIVPLRQRAATALATVGSPRLLKYFATILIKDDDSGVREQAARGTSNASRRGEEGHLLDLLGHADLAVRSWAAEGLARLGDARALPVLTGTLRHEHPPIRVGAILSFAALGPEGYGGMLQGLEDPSRAVQSLVLVVILARDLRAFRRGEPPELLTSALSSQRPEVRFVAARAIELRIDPVEYTAHLVELLMPERPEKAADMATWPGEETRARLMVGLAEALAGDRPEQRYAATQALRLRDRPMEYFREVQRAVLPRSVKAPWVPDTTPRAPEPAATPRKGPLAILRRLFASGAEADEKAPETATAAVPAEEQARLRQLAFGAYIGLLRQGTADDEAHRVRRDAVDRIVELCKQGHVSVTSATPALARALDDPNHLVRQAAFSALRKIYESPEVPLSLALASSSDDVVRAALDELAAKGAESKPRIALALDSNVPEARRYAFELLERLSPPKSLEPLLAALGSEHPDIRIGVLERLSTSQDTRVAAALVKALESDHDDLRLRAAEMLAARKDDRAADALGPWLRSDEAGAALRAQRALSELGTAAAVRALVQRFDDTIPVAERLALTAGIAGTRAGATTIDALVGLLADEDAGVRRAAFDGGIVVIGPRSDAKRLRGAPPSRNRDAALAMRLLVGAAHSRYADTRCAATGQLDDIDDAQADEVLSGLLLDRDRSVRIASTASYARRVEKKAAKPEPLEGVLRGGARETMLSAALGLAFCGVTSALRPLLLFARAGEDGEREQAVLGLGMLGDKRALAELETIALGGTEEAPAEVPMQAAAIEALGRLLAKLGPEDRDRIRDRVESSVGTKEPAVAVAALRGLRWIGGERARARIEGALVEKSSPTVERNTAATALGELGEVVAEAALARGLDDQDADVRWASREALDNLFKADRTRVEFLAVESIHDDISEPAASFLASEGDAGRLLGKLAKLSREPLRERIRFGLVRRDVLPTADLVKLLGEAAASARSDAAWVVGARAASMGPADRTALVPALLAALARAEKGYGAAAHAGKVPERDAELTAWVRALWAARELDAVACRGDARRWLADELVPPELRLQAVQALAGGAAADAAALALALSDPEPEVRSAAASALASTAAPPMRVSSPRDPVRLALASGKGAIAAGAVATSEGRSVVLPALLRTGQAGDLRALASKKGDSQLDALAALGRLATDEAIATLSEVAAKGGGADEATRKAAFRALRRASRISEHRKEAAAS